MVHDVDGPFAVCRNCDGQFSSMAINKQFRKPMMINNGKSCSITAKTQTGEILVVVLKSF